MGNTFILANNTKKEWVSLRPDNKEAEMILNERTAQFIAFYFFNHNGDEIAFIGDQWQVGTAHFWMYSTMAGIDAQEDKQINWHDGTEEAIRDFNEFVVSWQSPELQINCVDNTKERSK